MKNNSHGLFLGILLWVAAALLAGPALGAGGAHIVDDSEVETPGTCHLELWVSRFVPGDGYANVGPACTALKVPWLQFGVNYQHYWDEATAAPLIGPALKINFQPASEGVGVALGMNAGVNAKTGELGVASLLALVTVPVTEKFRINLNAGWSYLNAEHPTAFFWGGAGRGQCRLGRHTHDGSLRPSARHYRQPVGPALHAGRPSTVRFRPAGGNDLR